MKKLIVANWKMNPSTYKEAEDLISEILKGVKSAKATIVICPPFTWLTDFSHKNKSKILFGAQDVFYKDQGAFTGEISPKMLKSSLVDYVIVGHSERRKYFHEANEVINKKLRAVLEAKLTPIFCVGEQEVHEKSHVLEQQLTEGLKGISSKQVKSMVITYEPLFAISTSGGQVVSVEDTISSVLLIKSIISKLYNRDTADSVRVIYGGSVTIKNSASYLKESVISGVLVGGASLNAQEFIDIVKSAR